MLLIVAPVYAQSSLIRPCEVWREDRGIPIQAHVWGIFRWKNQYYWFGDDRGEATDPGLRYVACVSSKDLVHGKFRRRVVPEPPKRWTDE